MNNNRDNSGSMQQYAFDTANARNCHTTLKRRRMFQVSLTLLATVVWGSSSCQQTSAFITSGLQCRKFMCISPRRAKAIHPTITMYASSDPDPNSNNELPRRFGNPSSAQVPANWSSGPNSKVSLTRRLLLNHDMLTKEQEYELGTSVQRLRKIHKLLNSLIYRRKEEHQALLYEKRWESLSDEDDEDDDLLFAPSFRTNQLEDSELESYLRYTDHETILETQDRNSLVPPDWVDNVDSYILTNDDIDRLSDEDVRVALSLPGGKNELYKILVEGALARDRLIRCNYRLVVSIAKRWSKQMNRNGLMDMNQVYAGTWDRPSLDEAIQEGIIGLSKAVDRFEPKRGLRFSTYATYWITNSIRSCFQTAATGVLRVPVGFHDAKTKFRRLVKEYYEVYQEMPSIEQISMQMGLTQQRLALILQRTRTLLSTDAPIGSGVITRAGKAGNDVTGDEVLLGSTLVDRDEMKPEERIELSFLRQNLENAMATELAPHERDVLRLRLGLDDGVSRTAVQVAKECGGMLSANEVRATERRAYKKLRSPHALARYKLLAYLDFAGVDIASVSLR
jgi:RNA polymerase sigma factor (sigma-70 family)